MQLFAKRSKKFAITENKIRSARKAAGLTQKEVCELLDIPSRTWEDWEAGRRNPPSYVEKLVCEKLNNLAK